MQTKKLLETLTGQTEIIISKIELFKNSDFEHLIWKSDKNSWNILECLEHLNRYGKFYLPEIETQIKNSKYKNEEEFKSGFFGNYFAKSILPKEKLNKIKTFKSKDPLNENLDKNVIEEFLKQQNKLLTLLKESEKASLNKLKIKTTLSSLIRINLGDAFQFYINHMIRHLNQIDRIESAMKNSQDLQ